MVSPSDALCRSSRCAALFNPTCLQSMFTIVRNGTGSRFGSLVILASLAVFASSTGRSLGGFGPQVTSVGFTPAGDLQVHADVSPGFRHAVLEMVPEGGDPTNWIPMVAGPMTGASGTIRFTLPTQGAYALVRLRTGLDQAVPAAAHTGLEFMNVSYSDGGFFMSEDSQAVHVLNRLGYGPGPASLMEVETQGVEAYVTAQLAPETIDESENSRLHDRVDALFHEYLPYGGEQLLGAGEECRFFRGTSTPSADWITTGFDDGAWETGRTGVGYGDGDDATELDDMRFVDGVEPGYLSYYVRQTFDLDDPSAIDNLILRLRYDDGFVAYLNGLEVARANLSTSPLFHDTPADGAGGNVDDSSAQREWVINDAKDALVTGVNTLAIEVHNAGLTSSDASLIPALVSSSTTPFKAIRGVEELQQLLHVRGIYSRRQLQAVLAEFWENHFTTDYDKVSEYLEDLDAYQTLGMVDEAGARLQARTEAASLEYGEYQFLHDHALGNFGELLLYSASSPTMLVYLDNVLNLKDAPNENYAREILELHSHGVDNGYTQFDIEELARCFTGWTIRKVRVGDQQAFPASVRTPPITSSIAVDREVPVIDAGANWDFLRGTAEPTPDLNGDPTTDWTMTDYVPGGWENGPSGFGYGDGDDATDLSDMRPEEGVRPGYSSVYVRTSFTVTPGSFDALVLEVDYDDGFVAYLNGTEIARSRTMNDAGTPPAFDAGSGGHEAGNPAVIDLTSFEDLIHEAPTPNVIAIQGHNTSVSSSDFSLIPRLLQRNYTADSISEAGPEGVWTFRFDPDEHDIGAKVIFDGTPYQIDIPDGRTGVAGVDDAIEVIDALVGNPPTAEFICLKLVNRFVSDEISLDTYRHRTAPEWLLAMMDEAIVAWNSTTPKGNIATVLGSIFDPVERRNGFWVEGARFSKIKTPFELINSGFRALEAEVIRGDLSDRNEGMGMDLFQRDEPDGYSEIGGDWMDTLGLLERMKFGQALGLNNSFSRSEWDIAVTLSANGIATPADLIDHFDTLLFDGTLTLSRRSVLLDFANTDASGETSPFEDLGSAAQATRLRELTGLILATPEFQYQ